MIQQNWHEVITPAEKLFVCKICTVQVETLSSNTQSITWNWETWAVYLFTLNRHVSSAIDNYITVLKTTEGHNTDITNKLDKQK